MSTIRWSKRLRMRFLALPKVSLATHKDGRSFTLLIYWNVITIYWHYDWALTACPLKLNRSAFTVESHTRWVSTAKLFSRNRQVVSGQSTNRVILASLHPWFRMLDLVFFTSLMNFVYILHIYFLFGYGKLVYTSFCRSVYSGSLWQKYSAIFSNLQYQPTFLLTWEGETQESKRYMGQ